MGISVRKPTPGLEPGPLHHEVCAVGEGRAAQGWELGLADKEVDALIASQNVELLRRYRNGVFHFQREYFDERFLELIRDAKTSSRGCANSTCSSDAGSSNGSRLGKQSQPLGAGLRRLCLEGTHSLTHRFVRPLLVEEVNVALRSDGARFVPHDLREDSRGVPRSIIREAKACRKLYFLASTSAARISGGAARSSSALAISAAAISPLICASRASSLPKVSKIQNVVGAVRAAYNRRCPARLRRAVVRRSAAPRHRRPCRAWPQCEPRMRMACSWLSPWLLARVGHAIAGLARSPGPVGDFRGDAFATAYDLKTAQEDGRNVRPLPGTHVAGGPCRTHQTAHQSRACQKVGGRRKGKPTPGLEPGTLHYDGPMSAPVRPGSPRAASRGARHRNRHSCR